MTATAGGVDIEGLYRAHAEEVTQWIRRRCGSRATAEDLTHDAFLKLTLWARKHQWEERGKPPLAMLWTIARNLVIDYHRGAWQQRVTPVPDVRDGDDDPGSDPAETVIELEHQRWRRALVRQAMVTGLTARQFQVLTLRMAGLSVTEVAERCGMTEGAVKAALHRGRTVLRAEVERVRVAA